MVTTGWRIDPETLSLTNPELPDADLARYTAAEFAAQQWPPCPVCGATIDVDRLYVTLNEEDQRRNGDTYIPGRWDCPRQCDVRNGQRRHLSCEYGSNGDHYWLRCSCGFDEQGLNGGQLTDLLAEHKESYT